LDDASAFPVDDVFGICLLFESPPSYNKRKLFQLSLNRIFLTLDAAVVVGVC